MIHNGTPDEMGREENRRELARRLTQESGLTIFTEPRVAAQKGTPVQVQVARLAPEEDLNLYLAWEGPTGPDPVLLQLLEALARKIYQELLDPREKNQALEAGSWEWLMKKGSQEQWDSAEFARQAERYPLPLLAQGFPVYLHCAPWHSEIPEVLAHLYPLAQVSWCQEPDFFLWLPVGAPDLSGNELKARGEELIEEVYSLFADELGVSTAVFVGEPSQNNLWGGYLHVKELAALHARFFAGEPGLTSWNLRLAGLFSELKTSAAEGYQEKLLGALSEELLETLAGFLDRDLSIGDTAKTLFIHRNTLIYRLDRITELTGYNPRRLKGAVYFYLAVWLRKHLKY